ncbi:MAG: radical SAM protein [Desulfuromonadales bacterium]
MEHRIVLVNLPLADVSKTPFFVMPIGVMAVGAYIKAEGNSVDLLDMNVIKRNVGREAMLPEIYDRVREVQPTMVGLSVMIAGQFKLAREICKRVKEIFPKATTVLGGAHVSQFPEKILENCPEIDFVVIGEGETQALACAQYAKTRQAPHSWPDRLAHRLPSHEPKNFSFIDVNATPFPGYDLVNFEDYRHDTSTWHNPFQVDLSLRVPIITSRGCPNLCNFCSVADSMGFKHRPIAADKVVDMLEILKEKGAGCFAIFDANFAEDPSRVINICNQIVKRNLKITLDLPTGLPINATAPAMIDALAAAGLIRTCISVETGDEYIRNKVMLKNVDDLEIYRVVEAIRRHPQIFLMTDFVIGMPEDTEESLENSFQLVVQLDTDDIELAIATPYPGTKLFEQCVRDNLFLPDVDLNRLFDAEWYTHSNLHKFIIKPYNLSLATLELFKNRIKELRSPKIAAYKKRMAQYFSVEAKHTYNY